ncbi:MAG: Crp/Fnr family transcriptional regulator [Actinomycetota bacterium]|nr:Crp/Fnr family transcriptional regulator [Actinomycetota bacterium]
MDLREALSSAHLFAGAGPEELTTLAAAAFPRRLARGQVLFVEGERSDHLYVVVSGRLKVQVSSHHGDALLLAVLGAGESAGELSILDGRPRSATAEALDEVQLIAVPADTVRTVLAGSSALALAWAQDLALTVRRLTGSAADLVFLDLPRRLAKLLVGAGASEVDLGMSQSEVAARLGVARQSLNRALSGFTRRGWIQVEGSTVRLRDPAALARFAGS